MGRTLTSAEVKAKAEELGADLVGIASCRALEEHPPDPKVPQAPSRVMPSAKSAICLAKRTPWGEFLSDSETCVSLTNQLVMRRLEKVSMDLTYWLEDQGYPSFQIANEETDPDLKRGSYGCLSLRHVAVEAGLGTLGLNVNLLTPEFGPRVYLSVLLTDAELEPDPRMTTQVCIGPTCSRCLDSCPAEAVLHWDINKRRCSTSAQRYGVSSIIYGPLKELAAMRSTEEFLEVFAKPRTQGQWSAVTRLSNSFAACPRCVEVCPVGNDYKQYLAKAHVQIPEKTPAKVALAREMVAAEKRGEILGDNPISPRWIGEDGYVPPTKRTKRS